MRLSETTVNSLLKKLYSIIYWQNNTDFWEGIYFHYLHPFLSKFHINMLTSFTIFNVKIDGLQDIQKRLQVRNSAFCC